MVYITGDIHGAPHRIVNFAKDIRISRNDTLIILGDVGANYYLNEVDSECKHLLNSLKCTVFCIHGNHECRPEHIPSYRLIEWNGGKVWIEDAFPNLLFAKDGEIFRIEGQNYLVIGGAYSIDASWRIRRHAGWWADEQPSVSVKAFVEHQIAENRIDIVLSHTCPRKYEPVEVFLPNVNQAGVDKSTEDWLDTVENSLSYKAWYCGHWHTDKRIDRMHFLFTSWETVEKEVYDGTN